MQASFSGQKFEPISNGVDKVLVCGLLKRRSSLSVRLRTLRHTTALHFLPTILVRQQ